MVGGCVVVWFIVFSLRLHSMIGRNEKMNDASDCKCRERPRGSRMIAGVVTRRTGAELPPYELSTYLESIPRDMWMLMVYK